GSGSTVELGKAASGAAASAVGNHVRPEHRARGEERGEKEQPGHRAEARWTLRSTYQAPVAAVHMSVVRKATWASGLIGCAEKRSVKAQPHRSNAAPHSRTRSPASATTWVQRSAGMLSGLPRVSSRTSASLHSAGNAASARSAASLPPGAIRLWSDLSFKSL